MNNNYKLVYSETLNTWVAVAEHVSARGKKSAVRLVTAAALLAGGAVGTGWALAAPPLIATPAVNQLPTGAQVTTGTVNISQTQTATAANMAIQQSSNQAIVNWQSFNVGANAKVNITQPSSTSVLLNRVMDSNPSQIFGQVNANGQVFLSNPNGVYFAPGSSVDVGSFTATTHSISDADFLAGKYNFNRNGATGSITNEGSIASGLGGFIALLAPEVRNQGVVVAKVGGTVAMAAGESYQLQFNSNNQLTNVLVTPSTLDTLIENGNLVQAPAGLIILSAQAASSLLGGVVKNSGSISATGLVNDGGTIRLSASNKIELTSTSSISADAAPNSAGNGGRIDIITDLSNATGITQVDGSISAKGGDQGGDGGFVDTSAARLVIGESTLVTTGASKGKAGTWLLDPYDVSIEGPSGTASGTTYSNSFTAGTTSTILASSISASLDAGSNVSISTGSDSANTIYVNSAITATTGTATLTLTGGTINLAANIATVGSQTYSGAVVINNASGITLSSTNSNINFGSTVNSSTGNYYGLTVSNGTGTTAFGGVVGGTNALGYLCINAAGCSASTIGTTTGTGSTTLAGNVTTSGTQTYGGGLSLGTNTSLTSTANGGSGDITIAGSINSMSAMTNGIFQFRNFGNYQVSLDGTNWTSYTATSTADARGIQYLGLDGGTNQFKYNWIAPIGVSQASLLVIGGGGAGGGQNYGAGGGAGGVAYANNFAISAGSTAIYVGKGGASVNGGQRGNNGAASSFGLVVAGGGGGGGYYNPSGSFTGYNGNSVVLASLGGSTTTNNVPTTSTTGSVSGVTYLLNAGGPGNNSSWAGGGGGAGGPGSPGTTYYGEGGLGVAIAVSTTTITANSGSTFYAAGGGGYYSSTQQSGIGGRGVYNFGGDSSNIKGTDNTGSGGGGAYYGSNPTYSGAGGSGIVMVAGGIIASQGAYTLTINSGLGKASISGSVTNVPTLTINSTSNLSAITSAIGGSTALVKSGAGGILTLSGTNSYTGGTTVSAGTLQIGSGGSSGAISGNVINNGTLAFNRSDALTFSGVISGTGDLTKLGTGTLTLTGNNTYTGGSTVSAGTLQVGAGSTIGAITGNVTNNAALVFNRSDAISYSDVISGTGTLTKLGANALTLSGTNSYSGTTTISAGSIKAANASALGTGAVSIGAARTLDLTFSGTVALGSSLYMNTGAAITNSANTSSLSVAGTSTLLGTINTAGNQTYSGAVTLSANTTLTTLNTSSVNTNGAITFGSTVDSLAGNNYGLTVNNGTGTTSIASAVGASNSIGALALNGTGTITLNGNVTTAGNQTYAGPVTTAAGVQLTANDGLGTMGIVTNGNNNDSYYAFGVPSTANLQEYQVAAGTSSASVTSASNDKLGVVFYNNTGTLNGTTSGSWCCYNYPVLVNAGKSNYLSSISVVSRQNDNIAARIPTYVVVYGSNTPFTSSYTYRNWNDASLSNVSILGTGYQQSNFTELGRGALTITRDNNANLSNTISLNNSSAYQYFQIVFTSSGGISSGVAPNLGGSLALNSINLFGQGVSNAVTFNQAVTANGALTVNAGSLSATSISAAGSLLINSRNDSTITGSISDGSSAASLSKTGTGTLTLSGANTFTGGTTISAGTLRVGAGSTTGTLSGAVVNSGALVFNRSDAISVSSDISGTGSVTQSGTGTTSLTGSNTYAGGTTITAGTLQIGAGGNTGSINGNVTNNGTLAFNRSDDLTFSGVVSGTGSVTKTATGTITLTGTNLYTGATTVSAGTLAVANAAGLGDVSAGTTVASGATLDLQGVSLGAEALTLNGGTLSASTGTSSLSGTVSLSANSTATVAGTQLTLSGVVSGGSSLTKTGSGTLVLSGANTYTGATTVTSGTLAITHATGLGTTAGGVTVASGATLDLQGATVGTEAIALNGGTLATTTGTSSLSGAVTLGADSTINVAGNASQLTISGLVTGASKALTKSGTGNLILTARNTFSGGMTIAAGTATEGTTYDGTSGPLGSGTVYVTTGGTLDTSAYNIAVLVSLGGGSLVNNSTVVQNGAGDISAGVTLTSNSIFGGVGKLNAWTQIQSNGYGLAFVGSGYKKLSNTSNTLTSIASGAGVGQIDVTNNQNLTIGSVTVGSTPYTGLSSTGTILVKTITGNLTVNNNVVTSSTSSNASTPAIELAAGYNDATTSTNNNLILVSSASSLITAGSGAAIALYSGTPTSSSYLSEFATGQTTKSITYSKTTSNRPSASAGYYVMYRGSQPNLYVIYSSSGSSTYGSAPNVTYTFNTLANGSGTSYISTDTSTLYVTGTALFKGTYAPTGTTNVSLNASANAGNYTAVTYLSGLSSPLYTLTAGTGTGTFTIDPKPVSVTNAARSTTYNGVTNYNTLASGATFSVGAMVGSDSVASVTQTPTGLTGASTGVAQAGTFTVTPSAAVLSTGTASNYSFSYVPSTHTVDKVNLSVSATPSLTGNVYNGNAFTGTYTTTALNGETFTVTGQATGTNAGTYTSALNVSGAALANYNTPVITNANLVIDPKTVTVTNISRRTTYDGVSNYTTLANGTSFSIGTMVGSDSVASVTQTPSGFIGASTGVAQTGTLTVTPSAAVLGNGTASNYSFSYVPSTHTVDKANLSISATPSLNGNIYNGNVFTGTYTTTSVNGETFTVTGQATGTNAGTYTSALNVSGAALANYNTPVITNANLVISRKPASIANVARSTPYDGLSTNSDLGNGMTYTVSGLVGLDAVSSVTQTPGNSVLASSLANAGSFTVTPSAAVMGTGSASNYSFSYVGNTHTVNKATLNLAISKTYDGSNSFSNANTYTLTGMVNSESAPTISAGAATTSNADVNTYNTFETNTLALSDGNYTLTGGTVAATISPRPVSITNTSRSTTYDGVTNYTTLATATSYSVGAMVGSDAVASVMQTPTGFTGAATGAAQAGTFTVTPSDAVLGTGSASNYSFSYTPSTHTIDKANLSVSATPSLTGNVYKGSAYTGTYTTNAVNGETFIVAGMASGTNAGTYTSALNISGPALVNYNTPVIKNANLVISPKPLSVTANNASKTYDGAVFSGGNGVTYSGFVNNETSAVLVGTLGYAGTSQNAKNVGNYVISPNGLTSANYTVSFMAGSLTITPANLTLTALTNTKNFDGKSDALAVPTASGLIGSDTVSGLIEAYSDANPGTRKTLTVQAGYQISDGNNGNNYRVTLVPDQTGEIRAQAVAVLPPAAASASTTYAPPTLTVYAASGASKAAGSTPASSSVVTGSSSGVVVNTINSPTTQVTGLVAVLVPAGTGTAGTGLVIALPEQVLTTAVPNSTVQVTLPNNEPLPSWIRYDGANQTLVTTAVPSGAFPLTVVVTTGGQSTLIQISETKNNP